MTAILPLIIDDIPTYDDMDAMFGKRVIEKICSCGKEYTREEFLALEKPWGNGWQEDLDEKTEQTIWWPIRTCGVECCKTTGIITTVCLLPDGTIREV